jgi:hypothetical protein
MAIVNITVENDADFYRQFAYQMIDGTPIDLTGNTLRMGVRRRAEDVAEEMLLTTENGAFVIIDPPNGTFTMRITQDQLVHLDTGDYEHSLIRIETLAGNKYQVWSGALTNNAGPSR